MKGLVLNSFRDALVDENSAKIVLSEIQPSYFELSFIIDSIIYRYGFAFFHQSNNTNAQLIFVTHNTDILSKDYLRRDQIGFIEKNQFGTPNMFRTE